MPEQKTLQTPLARIQNHTDPDKWLYLGDIGKCKQQELQGVLEALKANKNSQRIDLSYLSCDEDVFAQIISIVTENLPLKAIKSEAVKLSDDRVDQLVAGITTYVPKLETLNVNFTLLSAVGLNRLCQWIANAKQLHSLNLGANSIIAEPESVKHICSAIAANPNLKDLDLSGAPLAPEYYQMLVKTICAHPNKPKAKLTSSAQSKFFSDDDSLYKIICLLYSTSQANSVLDMPAMLKPDHHSNSDVFIPYMVDPLSHNQNINEFSFHKIGFTQETLTLLLNALEKHGAVKILNFTECNISDALVDALVAMLKANKNIEQLYLNNNEMSAAALSKITKALEKFPHLTHFAFGYNAKMAVDNKNITSLKSLLTHHKTLKELDYQGINFFMPGEPIQLDWLYKALRALPNFVKFHYKKLYLEKQHIQAIENSIKKTPNTATDEPIKSPVNNLDALPHVPGTIGSDKPVEEPRPLDTTPPKSQDDIEAALIEAQCQAARLNRFFRPGGPAKARQIEDWVRTIKSDGSCKNWTWAQLADWDGGDDKTTFADILNIQRHTLFDRFRNKLLKRKPEAFQTTTLKAVEAKCVHLTK